MSQLFSQTLSQTLQPACVQCGGTEYVLESGYYFCMECQLQSQDIREEVYDEFVVGTQRKKIAPTLKPQESVDPANEELESIFTSWEALNVILAGLVHELILLGAPHKLKIVTLQLWAYYLMKTETAFISKQIEKRPRLQLKFRKIDAELVYGADSKTIRAQKEPVYRYKRQKSPDKTSNRSGESSFSTQRMEKLRLARKRTSLAKAEYAASSSFSNADSELTLENLSTRSPSDKRPRLKYTKTAKLNLLELLDVAVRIKGSYRKNLQRRYFNEHAHATDHPTIRKLLAILRISLLIIDSDIHLGDLLRWSDEGYLSLLNTEKFIPSGVKVKKDLRKLFTSTLNSRENINKDVTKIANYLGVYDLKARILPLIQRYLKELCLPNGIFKLIKSLIAVKPPDLRLTTSINYEARALAFIIFALKYLLGLDGLTEKKISEIAMMVNRNMKESKKLFCWTEWMRFINCRNSVISCYNTATRDIYHPSSVFGGVGPFLSQWEKIPQSECFPRTEKVINKNLAGCLRRVMKEFAKIPTEPLSPSLFPLTTNLETILKTKGLPSRTRKILQHDFTEDTIDYLINKDMQQPICREYGVSLEDKLAANFLVSTPPNQSEENMKNVDTNVFVTLKGSTKKSKTPDITIAPDQYFLNKNILPDFNCYVNEFIENENIDSKEKFWSGAGRGYWIYHSSLINDKTQKATFEHLTKSVFQLDFLWLLKELSLVGHVSPKGIYRELTKVENMYLKILPFPKKYKVRGLW